MLLFTLVGLALGAEQRSPADVANLPFTPDTVREIVQAGQPRIQACYEEHLALNRRSPQGTLKTSWVITPAGRVKSARVTGKTSTLRDRQLRDCVVAALSAMVFPRPPDGKDHPVEFPFNLKVQH
jgi:hypothetical protein